MSYNYNDQEESSSESESSETFYFDTKNLQPYSYESSAPPPSDGRKKQQTSSPLSRNGNANWCACGECRPMDKCCQEGNEEINVSLRRKALLREVLKTTLRGLNHFRGDEINICNRSLRYVGYRMFTWWVHNRLGRGVRKVIPACAIWAIRDAYPDSNKVHYLPFQEMRDS